MDFVMGENGQMFVETETIGIIVRIPKNTARLQLAASFLDEDGTPQTLRRVMDVSDIRDARNDFIDNVEAGDDYDAVYVVTDKGLRWLDELEQKRQSMKSNYEDCK